MYALKDFFKMPKPNYQKMMEYLALMLRCPVCNSKYSTDETDIIENREGERFESSTMLVHTDCQHCKSSVVFNVSMDGPEIFSVGMVTDLTSRDAKKFRDAGHITTDEVLHLHEFLSKFNGDFERLLMNQSTS